MQKWLIRKRLRCVFGGVPRHSYLVFSSNTKKIDISDSKAVIQYVECQHMTCSFRVTIVSTHKILYQKQLCSVFGLISRQLYLAYRSNQENKYLQQQSNRQIGKTSSYHLQLSSCVYNYTQNGLQESHYDTCFGP